MTHERYDSEDVVLSAPMSFTGSAQRLWKLTARSWNDLLRWFFLIPVVVFLIFLAWTVIGAWYMIFGLLLVPYRLFRRSGRKNKADKKRHREMMNAMNTAPRA